MIFKVTLCVTYIMLKKKKLKRVLRWERTAIMQEYN